MKNVLYCFYCFVRCEIVGCSQCRGLLPVVWLCVAIQEWNDKVPQPQG